MRALIIVTMLAASVAHAGGLVLGPPPESSDSSSAPGNPLPPETLDCIVAALNAGLNSIEECEL